MSFKVSNEFFIRALCALLELVTPAQWEYKESHLLPTISRGAQLTTTIHPATRHRGQTRVILIKQQIITIRPWTRLVWEGNENIYFFL